MTKFKKIAARRPARTPRGRAALAVLVLAGVLGLGDASRAGPPNVGGVIAENFTWLDPPAAAPETPIARPEGGEVTVRAFRGRVVLLNFWATWCAPCVREMPSLDRLQARLKGDGLVVLAVSQDRSGMEVVAPFLERLGLKHLEVYLDPAGALGRAVGVTGLPTTLLIDREGRVVGGLEGPAEWDSDEAVELVRHYLRHPA